jgi:chemotaxis response regulator CheB
MPREAVRLGTAAQVLPLGRIAASVMTHGMDGRKLVTQ